MVMDIPRNCNFITYITNFLASMWCTLHVHSMRAGCDSVIASYQTTCTRKSALHSFFYNTRSLRLYILNGRLVRVMQFSALLHFPIYPGTKHIIHLPFHFDSEIYSPPQRYLVWAWSVVCLSSACCAVAMRVLLSFTMRGWLNSAQYSHFLC